MLKYFVVLALVLGILAAGLYYAAEQEAATPNDDPQIEAVGESSSHSTSDLWQFTELPEKDGIPQTSVSFDVHGTVVEIGTYEGNCADMAGSAWPMREGASSGAICWFAGGGTEIAVFHEGDKHVIKTAILEEGTAETAGIRGEMVTKLSI